MKTIFPLIENGISLNDYRELSQVNAKIAVSKLQENSAAKLICLLLPMGQMVEEVVEWNEGHSIVMKVIGGKKLPPCRFMKGEIYLKELNGKTKVTFSFSYRLKFGILGKIMDALIIKPQFKNAPPKYVNGLKEYVENIGQ